MGVRRLAAEQPVAAGLGDVVVDRAEARAFLAEVRRVPRPGGVVRIAAPDLSRIAGAYVASGDADGFVAGLHRGLDRPAGWRGRARWTLVGPRHHRWMDDGGSLTRLRGEAGFAQAAAVVAPGSAPDPRARAARPERARERERLRGSGQAG